MTAFAHRPSTGSQSLSGRARTALHRCLILSTPLRVRPCSWRTSAAHRAMSTLTLFTAGRNPLRNGERYQGTDREYRGAMRR